MEFLEWTLYQNSVGTWLLAVLAAGMALALLGLARALLLRQLARFARRTNNDLDDVVAEVLGRTRLWFLAAVAVWVGSSFLLLPERFRDGLEVVVVLVSLLQLAVWGNTAIRAYVRVYGERKMEEDPASVTTVRALGFLARLAFWTVIFLVALDNLGIDVTALVAGLGVGGIAVALAVQNILGDLFGSLSIVLDKPFVCGDFIIVDDMMGTVEHIGLKTTRVRSLSGEQLVFANSDLLKSRVRNYKRMQERRVLFGFGVVYQTPRATLERIPGMVREAVEALPNTRFDRAHFKGFGDSSLDFEVVYYMLEPDYNVYMDAQQAINLTLFGRFEEEGIDFAYPTRTLHVSGELAAAGAWGQ